MTNGEKMKETFPSMKVGFITDSQIGIYFVKNQTNAVVFSLDWWNAKYNKPAIDANGISYKSSIYKAKASKEIQEDLAKLSGSDMQSNTKRKGVRKGQPVEGNNDSYNCENWIP